MSLKIIVKNSVNWSHGGIKRVFADHPKFSSACTGFVTFSLGDVIAQKLEKGGNKVLDLKRSMKVGLLGFVMNGVFLTRWFDYLDRVVGTCMHTKANVICKVVADQLVYAPLAIMAYFSYATATLADKSNADSSFLSKMVDDFWPTFAADCTIWPIANVVNFRYILLMYRASFTSFVALIWQTYLSVVAYAEGETPAITEGSASGSIGDGAKVQGEK